VSALVLVELSIDGDRLEPTPSIVPMMPMILHSVKAMWLAMQDDGGETHEHRRRHRVGSYMFLLLIDAALRKRAILSINLDTAEAVFVWIFRLTLGALQGCVGGMGEFPWACAVCLILIERLALV
jgi:hypothetical protein